MDSRRMGEPLANTTGASAADSKPLKKKKSLTRLLSSSSRKSSVSRTSPMEDQSRPTTPQLPAQFRPSTPIALKSPRIPTMNFDFLLRDTVSPIRAQQQSDEENKGHGRQEASSSRPVMARVNSTTTVGGPSEGASPNTSVRTSDCGLRHSLSVGQMSQHEKPTTPHAPTYPTLPKRSKTGLRMPSAPSTPTRGSLASMASSLRKSSASQHQLSRPSTPGGDYYPRPTGKRRPSVRPTGEEVGRDFIRTSDDVPPIPPRLWQGESGSEELRSSFRSAVTNSSSPIDTTSTERSSVLTRGTSITDSTVDVHSRPMSKVEGTTVEEAIEMYVAGFDDSDDDVTPDESKNVSISEEERKRSMRIAEAINDEIDGLGPPVRPATAASTSSHNIMSGDALRSQSPEPPPIQPPTATRDQYGFLKASHNISLSQYDAWYNGYRPNQERRTKKWTSYLREQRLPTYLPTQFPRPSTKTERFIRKGIPPAWRGPAWFFYAGGQAYLDRHSGLYTSLATRSESSLSSNDKEAIERDLHRTFPDNIHFKPDSHISGASSPEPPLLISLRRVLRAFALHNPRIGYCQSLNFLAGLLLLFLPEEKCFWMLHIITTIYLPGTHEVSLEGANVDLWVLMVALRSTMPNIWAKVGSAGTPGDDLIGNARLPPISLCTTSWFMSLFIGTLPIESVLRVWDILFYEGSRTLFRVALTIFKLGEAKIREVSDPMELFQVVQGLPRGMIDARGLIMTMNRRAGVSREWVEAKRRERRAWYAQEKMRTPGVMDVISRDEYFGQKEGATQEALKRKDSVWKRRKRNGSMPERREISTSAGGRAPKDALSEEGRRMLVL